MNRDENEFGLILVPALLAGFFFGKALGGCASQKRYEERMKQTSIIQYDVDRDGNPDLVFLTENRPYDYFISEEGSYNPTKETSEEKEANLSELEKALGE